MDTSFYAGIAQLVERLLAMQKVASSNLVARSKFSSDKLGFPTKQNASKYLTKLESELGHTFFISRNFVIFHPSLSKRLPAQS
jgi:hypothetical protein